MKPLEQQSCQAISKGSPAMDASQVRQYLPGIPQWTNINNNAIERDFKFKDYYQAIAFVNAVANIVHQCDHHPDMEIGYNHCKITYTTHSVNGLSLNDFICAAKIDRIQNDES